MIRLKLPPLRERREDIPLLVQHFIQKFNALQGKHIAGVSPEVMARLLDYDYPGNVRELENIIEHAFVLCHGTWIEMHHLPPELRLPVSPVGVASGVSLQSMEKQMIVAALERHRGNRRKAARELGIHPSTLYRKLRAYGLVDRPAR